MTHSFIEDITVTPGWRSCIISRVLVSNLMYVSIRYDREEPIMSWFIYAPMKISAANCGAAFKLNVVSFCLVGSSTITMLLTIS